MKPNHILIVEDDFALRRGLRDNFVAQGYTVSLATDGTQGLQAALAEPPQLMLLDLMLPELDGLSLCRTVRERGHDYPIIMLTARGQEDDIVRGLEAGADDYVTKPFSIRELLARVRAFLRKQTPDAQIISFGAYQLSLSACTLTRDGEVVPLTTKEFGLLAHFVRRAGRALTRDSILNAVWGDEVMVSDRSVDRCVTTLRAKIEPDSRHPTYIKTVRDIGYRFELPA